MPASAIRAYRQNALQGASRGELLLALYDGGLQYAEKIRAAIAANDPGTKGRYVNALIAVISELQSTLDHDQAPELCANLDRLYAHCSKRLLDASRDMDMGPVNEVAGHLRGLREAWAEAVRRAAAGS